jgi:hypothetical protein
MKVGGGGSERYMVIVPAVVGFAIIVYALGGPNQTLIYLETMAQGGWEWVQSMIR